MDDLLSDGEVSALLSELDMGAASEGPAEAQVAEAAPDAGVVVD